MGDSEDLRFKYFVAAGIGALFGIVAVSFVYHNIFQNIFSLFQWPGVALGVLWLNIACSSCDLTAAYGYSAFFTPVFWSVVAIFVYSFFRALLR